MGQAAVHLKEHVLHDVVEVGARAQHAVRDRCHSRPVFAEQLAESGCVTALGTLHQLIGYAL
jgi:hypothetical protein